MVMTKTTGRASREYPLAREATRAYVSVQEDVGLPKGLRWPKESGVVWTPMYIARMLVRWAVRLPTDAVLDPGSGRGIFLFEVFRRLLALGASPSRARSLLYGVEQDSLSFRELKKDLESFAGGPVSHLHRGNLFECNLPQLDAVVGNPPYVRRWWLDNLDLVRERLPEQADDLRLTRLTDLACYFTIYSARFLKPGGRLALVVSDGWLDADYGIAFKRFLLQQFHLRQVIGFQHRVFGDVLVRPVLILGEKKAEAVSRRTQARTVFALTSRSGGRPRGTLSVGSLVRHAHHTFAVEGGDLRPESSWGQYLNAPPIYFRLMGRRDFRPLAETFRSRIGLQTFAKSFFVIPRAGAAELRLEEKYLHPLLLSPRELEDLIISENQSPNYFLVWCDVPKSSLRGTRLAEYIDHWEGSQVTARGARGEFIGVQNLPRLRRAGRIPWYNVKSEVERRGIYPILVPRRIFDNYIVAWNRAAFVPAENFLELAPRGEVDIEAALAVLNSSVAELIFRSNAHLYGGGVYNLNPGDIRGICLPDLGTLSPKGIQRLRQAFRQYVRGGAAAREALDWAIGRTLDLSTEAMREAQQGISAFKVLSRRVKTPTAGALFATE